MKRDNSQQDIKHQEKRLPPQQQFYRQPVFSPAVYPAKEQREWQPPRGEYVQSPRWIGADKRPPLPSATTPVRENRDPGGHSASYRNLQTPQEYQQQSGSRLGDKSNNRSHAEWDQQSGNSATSKYKKSQVIDRGHTESDEILTEFELKRQKNTPGSNSHGRLLYLEEEIQGMVGSASTKKLDKATNSSATLYEYRHLHEKLNTLENKILTMRNNLEKKKEDKKKFLEEQIRDRQERERQIKEKAEAERRQKQYRESRRRQIESTRERSRDKQKSDRQKDESSDRQSRQQRKKDVAPLTPPASSGNQSSPLKGLVTQVPQHKELRYFDFNPYSPRNNIYYVSQVLKAYKEEKSLVREHLLSSMHLLKTLQSSKRPTMFDIAAKGVNLMKSPLYKDKKTVVFDLDQTLIHCNQSTNVPYDVKIPIKFPTGEIIEAGINIRPYAYEILRNLAEKFELIVFTASHSCYANVVLDTLDPQKKYIQHRLFRQHCHSTGDGMFVKDLRVINRPLSDLVLVDNAAYSYAFQPQNGIPIIPYYEGRNDYELSSLQRYLQQLLLVKDVRQVNRKTFKLDQYRNYEDPDQLVRELYNSHS